MSLCACASLRTAARSRRVRHPEHDRAKDHQRYPTIVGKPGDQSSNEIEHAQASATEVVNRMEGRFAALAITWRELLASAVDEIVRAAKLHSTN
jgi:hypothetical protein